MRGKVCARFEEKTGRDLRSGLAHDVELTCDIIEVDLRHESKIGG